MYYINSSTEFYIMFLSVLPYGNGGHERVNAAPAALCIDSLSVHVMSSGVSRSFPCVSSICSVQQFCTSIIACCVLCLTLNDG